jgi:hypothetical protein
MSAGAHLDPSNKKVALTIAVLAVLLAFCETLGKGAQTEALNRNIEAANLWAFFQAKTIRMSLARTAADTAELQLPVSPEPARAGLTKRIDEWRKTAERYDTEPKEGRKDLAARATTAEKARDHKLAAYHQYETASAALQIAIVLASANVITGAAFLLWGAFGLGIVGAIFCAIGFFAPTAVHLF